MAKVETAAVRDFLAKVQRAFRGAYPPPDFVDVSEGYQGHAHVVVVSRKFDDMSEREKQDIVWSLARDHLGADAQKISILLAYSPDELKG